MVVLLDRGWGRPGGCSRRRGAARRRRRLKPHIPWAPAPGRRRRRAQEDAGDSGGVGIEARRVGRKTIWRASLAPVTTSPPTVVGRLCACHRRERRARGGRGRGRGSRARRRSICASIAAVASAVIAGRHVRVGVEPGARRRWSGSGPRGTAGRRGRTAASGMRPLPHPCAPPRRSRRRCRRRGPSRRAATPHASTARTPSTGGGSSLNVPGPWRVGLYSATGARRDPARQLRSPGDADGGGPGRDRSSITMSGEPELVERLDADAGLEARAMLLEQRRSSRLPIAAEPPSATGQP